MNTKTEGSETDPGRPADAPGSKRPHATLDLKATEIKGPAPDKPAEGPKPAEPKTAATGSQARPGKPQPGRPANPAATRPSGLGRLTSHLVAGLAGGALALFGSDWMSDNLGVETPTAALSKVTAAIEARLAEVEAGAKAGAELTDRLAAAEQRIAETTASGTATDTAITSLKDGQAKLAEEAKALSEAIAAAAPAQAALDRIGKLEEQLSTLAAAAASEPDGGRIPQLAAITAKIAELETTLSSQLAEIRKSLPEEVDARIAGVVAASEEARSGTQRLDRELSTVKTETARAEQRIDEIRTEADRASGTLLALQDTASRLAAEIAELRRSLDAERAAVARPADISQAVAPLSGRLETLEQNLKDVVASEEDRKASAERIVVSLELASLKRVLDQGHRFAAELDTVKTVAGDGIDLSALEQYKNEGVPTLADLQRDFRAVMHAVIDADAAPAEGSVVDRLIAGAKSVVRVRKVSHTAGDTSTEATLARMEEALKDGRLGQVLEEARAIAPKASVKAQDWLSKVEARHAVDVAVAGIEQQLKSSLSGTRPAGASPQQ